MPVLALLPFIDRNFEEKFAVLRRGPGGERGYMTVKRALEDGAVVMSYGYVCYVMFGWLFVYLAIWLSISFFASICAWNRDRGNM